MSLNIPVLYEDNHLLVVNKPAGIATMGAEDGEPTVHRWACQYLRQKYNKPGKVFLGIVSRLDTMTSGTLVLARTSKAAARLQKQFAAGGDDAATKVYLGIVEGTLDEDTGHLVDWVSKDDAARRMRTVASNHTEAKRAELDYLKLGQCGGQCLLAIRLRTGRKHQIRVQFADRGHAILGDRKYSAGRIFPQGIALHSWRLRIHHPTQKDERWYTSQPPASWAKSLQKMRIDSLSGHWPVAAKHFQICP